MTATSERPTIIEQAFRVLIGLQLIKSWNVLATRFFYFGRAGIGTDEGEFRLEVDCPWRIEQSSRIIVGSDDYAEEAEISTDDGEELHSDHRGCLQDQKLGRLLGELREGAVFTTRSDFVVESVRADALGGFQLFLSGEAALSVFPTSTTGLQWLFSRPREGNFSLMDERLSGSLIGSE